jgi:hypothetical protein
MLSGGQRLETDPSIGRAAQCPWRENANDHRVKYNQLGAGYRVELNHQSVGLHAVAARSGLMALLARMLYVRAYCYREIAAAQ